MAQLHFKELIQHAQTYQSFVPDEDHAVFSIFFDLEIMGEHYRMEVALRQPFGTAYESEPLEVARPKGQYDGRHGYWSHSEFSDLCEQYCRAALGAEGRGVNTGGARNVLMANNRVVMPMDAIIELKDKNSAAW